MFKAVFNSPPPKEVAAALYNAFYDSTFRQVLAITGNEELAVEATQEGFVRAFERFGSLRNTDKFSSWVVSIALNVARDIMRDKAREIPVDAAEFPLLLNLTDNNTTEQIAVAKDTSQSLHNAFESLPIELKEVVTLYYINEMRVSEISRRLNIPKGTVQSRLHRARKRLRKILELKSKTQTR